MNREKYPDPERNMANTLKLSYVVDVDGSWLLGSGIYADNEVDIKNTFRDLE